MGDSVESNTGSPRIPGRVFGQAGKPGTYSFARAPVTFQGGLRLTGDVHLSPVASSGAGDPKGRGGETPVFVHKCDIIFGTLGASYSRE